MLIAGGGVGALEAALALQALIRERVEVVMLAPDRHFTYRPLAVGQPFGLGATARFELLAIAKDRGFIPMCSTASRPITARWSRATARS